LPLLCAGLADEFIFVGRLDNLAMSYLSLAALIDASSDADLAEETAVRAVALFDHEEVGSASAQGEKCCAL
jgi:aspartyl aminopeptidase